MKRAKELGPEAFELPLLQGVCQHLKATCKSQIRTCKFIFFRPFQPVNLQKDPVNLQALQALANTLEGQAPLSERPLLQRAKPSGGRPTAMRATRTAKHSVTVIVKLSQPTTTHRLRALPR